MAQLPALTKLDGVQRFEFTDVTQLGADVRLRARLASHWQKLMQNIHLIQPGVDKAL
jgi:diaminohydroxyphosphoribosylaminopyrimidine deaminase/5-amino-6-(5-phosphoribosylamino)uracil reductase